MQEQIFVEMLDEVRKVYREVGQDWKVCTVWLISPLCNFDAFHIFPIKFCKSLVCNFQRFQSGGTVGWVPPFL